MSPTKAVLLAKAVVKTCDSLDGLADGVIANVSDCKKAFDLHKLACVSGDDEGNNCLSNAQIAAAESIVRSANFGFSLSDFPGFNGWPILEGVDAEALTEAAFGTKPVPDRPPTQADSGLFIMADLALRYMALGNATADSLAFRPLDHVAALQRLSQIIDASSPDLDASCRFDHQGSRWI